MTLRLQDRGLILYESGSFPIGPLPALSWTPRFVACVVFCGGRAFVRRSGPFVVDWNRVARCEQVIGQGCSHVVHMANLEVLKVDPVDAAFHDCSNPHTHAGRNIGTRLGRRTTELEQSRRFRVERDRWLARDRNLFLAAYWPFFLAGGAVPLEQYALPLNHVLETHPSDAATVLAATRNLQRNRCVGHGWDKGESNVNTRNSTRKTGRGTQTRKGGRANSFTP